jgi:hypothetical protein
VFVGVHGQQVYGAAQFMQCHGQTGYGNAFAVLQRVWKFFAELQYSHGNFLHSSKAHKVGRFFHALILER